MEKHNNKPSNALNFILLYEVARAVLLHFTTMNCLNKITAKEKQFENVVFYTRTASSLRVTK